MPRDHLISLLKKIIEADGSEEEIDAWINQVSKSVAYPSWTDLVFHDARELTVEEVADEILSYQPIQL
ncbi:MAG: bacteriocin immunity protein [Myxococcales bacterium]|nr:bacteriocin immunity protein [Myxococcales bacterium]